MDSSIGKCHVDRSLGGVGVGGRGEGLQLSSECVCAFLTFGYAFYLLALSSVSLSGNERRLERRSENVAWWNDDRASFLSFHLCSFIYASM